MSHNRPHTFEVKRFCGCLIAGGLGIFLGCTSVGAQEGGRLLFGLTGTVGLRQPLQHNRSSFGTLGVFMDYAVTRRTALHLELHRGTCSKTGCLFGRSGEHPFKSSMAEDWSVSVMMNVHLAPISSRWKPYVGLGGGRYYLQDSRETIDEGRAHPEEARLEYDLRRYLRRRGLFGVAGMRFEASPRVDIFLQMRCGLLFEDPDDFIVPESITDHLNARVGFRYILN